MKTTITLNQNDLNNLVFNKKISKSTILENGFEAVFEVFSDNSNLKSSIYVYDEDGIDVCNIQNNSFKNQYLINDDSNNYQINLNIK